MDQPNIVDVKKADLKDVDMKTEAGLRKVIEEIKKAYKSKGFDKLELYYRELVRLNLENIQAKQFKFKPQQQTQEQQAQEQILSKLLNLAENLAGYCLGAMYLFHDDSIKPKRDDKHGRAT